MVVESNAVRRCESCVVLGSGDVPRVSLGSFRCREWAGKERLHECEAFATPTLVSCGTPGVMRRRGPLGLDEESCTW